MGKPRQQVELATWDGTSDRFVSAKEHAERSALAKRVERLEENLTKLEGRYGDLEERANRLQRRLR